MKKNVIIGLLGISLFCLLSTVVAQNQKAQDFNIQGKLLGDTEGIKLYLKNGDMEILDSTTVQNNEFRFKGKIAYPWLHIISIQPKGNAISNKIKYPIIPLFLEPGDVKIEAELSKLNTEFDFLYKDYNYDQLKIDGSKATQDLAYFSKGLKPFNQQWSDAFDQYLYFLNSKNPKEREDYKKGVRLVAVIDSTAKNRKEYLKAYIQNNAKSFLANYLFLDNLERFDLQEMKSFEELLLKNSTSPILKQKISEKVASAKQSAIGSPFVDLTLKTSEGKEIQLADYLGKGKYVLLEFWASWCAPCRADIPHLKKVYERYNKEGFEIIGISMDEKEDHWQQALQEEKLPWLQVSELKGFKGQVSNAYNFQGIPTCVLIDPKGNIVTRNMRGSWMDKKLIDLYGNKFD